MMNLAGNYQKYHVILTTIHADELFITNQSGAIFCTMTDV